MHARTRRRIAVATIAAGITAGAMVATLGGSASAEVPAKAHSQVATPPKPGTGVTIQGVQAAPLGPLSLT